MLWPTGKPRERTVLDGLPFPLRAYRALSAAATPLAPLLISRRLRAGKEHPQRWIERRGVARFKRPRGPLVWVHGASVGELASVIPLIEEIRTRNFAVLVTSGTRTSATLAEQRMPSGVMHQFVPLDVPRFVARFLDHWQPDLGLFVEADLWPNMILSSTERGVPLILVNGRMSERSFDRWRYAPHTIAALLRRFDLCLAQSAIDATRYAELGAPRLGTTGNLKLDVPAPSVAEDKLRAAKFAIGQRPTIAAASTHPGEESLLIDVHRRLHASFPGLLTIIVPRHPNRGRAIADLAAAAGLKTQLRSTGHLPQLDTEVYVADTLGELGLIYRLAAIVFMGGSLTSNGGHNPVEAAKLAVPIVHGPHVWNFAEIYAALDAAHGAEQVTDAGKLAVKIGAWLTDTAAREAVANAALTTMESLCGALTRTLTALDPYLLQLRLQKGPTDA
jgi:3-deoxy-D-manno-octulosonic-acid transferase